MKHIGIAGPIKPTEFREHLDIPNNLKLLDGLGGTPVNNLVHGLLKRGFQVTVFSLDQNVVSNQDYTGNLLKICLGPIRRKHRARDFFRLERAYLKKAIIREKPDIIHGHWTYEFALGALATGLPTLITAHDAPIKILRYMPDPYRFMRMLMAFAVARKARNMTTVSPHVADHFKNVLRFRYKLNVIPNGIPDYLFDTAHKPQKNADMVTFASILTGWGKLKNGCCLLKAFARFSHKFPNFRLLIFGTGHGPNEEGTIWAKNNNLDKNVEFAGDIPYTELMSRLTKEVDILVHPSLEEGCPMAIAEAMALGIPVIGGDKSGGVPFTLEYGRAGILVDVKSPVDVSEAMVNLATNPALRNQIGKSARRSARSRFHNSIVIDQYIQAYLQLLDNSNGL